MTLALRGQRELVLENLALRQQLIVMNRTTSRRHLQAPDRLFWIAVRRDPRQNSSELLLAPVTARIGTCWSS